VSLRSAAKAGSGPTESVKARSARLGRR
jgi:hypothetical protein